MQMEMTDKIDLKTKFIKKDKKGSYIMIKDHHKKRILHLLTYMYPI